MLKEGRPSSSLPEWAAAAQMVEEQLSNAMTTTAVRKLADHENGEARGRGLTSIQSGSASLLAAARRLGGDSQDKSLATAIQQRALAAAEMQQQQTQHQQKQQQQQGQVLQQRQQQQQQQRERETSVQRQHEQQQQQQRQVRQVRAAI